MTPPKRLSPEAAQWWAKVQQAYAITDPGGLLYLQTACEAFDRMRQAQEAIAADGPQVPDRFGQLKGHPLLTTERDSRAQMLAALKSLNLDIQPGQPGPGCPPNRYGGLKNG